MRQSCLLVAFSAPQVAELRRQTRSTVCISVQPVLISWIYQLQSTWRNAAPQGVLDRNLIAAPPCNRNGLIILIGKTDAGGQRREEYFPNSTQQSRTATRFAEGHEGNLCQSQEFNPDLLLGSLP